MTKIPGGVLHEGGLLHIPGVNPNCTVRKAVAKLTSRVHKGYPCRRRKFWNSTGLLAFLKVISELPNDRTERIFNIEISDLVHDFWKFSPAALKKSAAPSAPSLYYCTAVHYRTVHCPKCRKPPLVFKMTKILGGVFSMRGVFSIMYTGKDSVVQNSHKKTSYPSNG